ncbi:hypothetical protein SP90_04830 [Halodesulfovibrio spirochaetisodalis]|uniref:Uncharacterized protein n=1 Tax=Halodesulfovibrio spirochaetisodalis TaxID=1560234 RepID=A0A1B7XH17_9BACT|nr:hypothetical protein SP90_04830 [Halodesulfovibrio spirochaetisodalis]
MYWNGSGEKPRGIFKKRKDSQVESLKGGLGENFPKFSAQPSETSPAGSPKALRIQSSLRQKRRKKGGIFMPPFWVCCRLRSFVIY